MSATFEAYRPGADDAETLALRAEVWGADHGHNAPGFYEWIFGRNPDGAGVCSLLRRDGALVGFAGGAPRRMRFDGEIIRIAHGLDYMVAPSARGGGGGGSAVRIVRDWAARCSAEGLAFGVCFPNANSLRVLTSDLLGWKLILAPSFLVRPLPRIRFAGEAPAKLPPWLATLGARTVALAAATRAIGARGNERIVELDRFDERFDALWRRAPAPRAYERDAAYLSWRYVGHPLYRYRILAVERDSAIDAFLVVSPRTLMGLESWLVVDGWAAPENAALLSSLAAEAARLAGESGASILGAQAAPGSQFEAGLKRAGFFAPPAKLNPKPFVLLGLPLANPPQGAFDARGWHLTWGDMDVV